MYILVLLRRAHATAHPLELSVPTFWRQYTWNLTRKERFEQ